VDPATARVHAEGWQSWTPTTSYSLADRQWSPVRTQTWTSGYGGSRPRPPARPGVFQGDGLVVVDPGTGEDIVTVGARSADEPIAAVRCEYQKPDRVVLRADAPASVSRSAAGAGLEAGAAAFAAGFAAASGVAPIRPPPTTWCSWYQYFTEVSQADVLENLDAIRTSELPVDVVQLDDWYQSEIGDWLSPSRRFASLEGMVDRIRATGPGPASGSRRSWSAPAPGSAATTPTGWCAPRPAPRCSLCTTGAKISMCST